ncbi:MAG: protein kinase [Isosphaeraceae bacterium]
MSMNEPASLAGSLATEFRSLWETTGESPDVFGFLAARADLTPRQRLDVLRVDVRQRWKRGEPLSLKVYLSRLPDVAADPDLVRLLVESDQKNRREFGPLSGILPVECSRTSRSCTRVIVESHDRETIADEAAPTLPGTGTDETAPPRALLDTAEQSPPPDRLDFELTSGIERLARAESLRPLIESPRFTLISQLGAGGMGVVYEAFDQDRGEFVALKTMRHVDQTSLVRFKQEFRALSDITHPNLVNLYQLFAVEPPWFFTMELVEGPDFLTYVRGRGASGDMPETRLSHHASPPGGTPDRHAMAAPGQGRTQLHEGRLRDALRQLVEGVHALHQAGKLHRDIKPTNVLVSRRGLVKLLDFGLTADLEPSGEHRTADRQVVGTLAHMSPEQAIGSKVTRASDWYSVGVMLYQALTGLVPFSGSYEEVVGRKLSRQPDPPDALAEALPPDLVGLCMELLRRDPTERPDGPSILARLDGKTPCAAAPSLPRRDVALIGRTHHRQVLDSAYSNLLAGRSTAVLVHGRTGAGKTALVRSFVEELAADKQTLVLCGRCHERECVAFKALDSLIDHLARYLKQLDNAERATLLPDDAALLSRVFLVLRGLQAPGGPRPEEPTLNDPQETRIRGFAALRELLRRLGERVNLVLAIDDLQWGDSDSALLLSELLYAPDAPRLLFLGCYRLEDAEQSQLLPILRQARLNNQSGIEHHELAVGPLTQAESWELARQLLGDASTNLAVAHLVAIESERNPLFIEELVKYVQAGNFSRDLDGSVRLDLDAVLWARIQAQPADAQRLLEIVSVSGRPIRETLAFRAAELGAGGRVALGSLRSARLIRNLGEGRVDTVEIYHDRIRDAVREHLPAESLRQIHERLAQVYEESGQTDPEVLAVHYQGAGDRERACRFYVQAGEKAFAALAFDHAARLYLSALELHPGPAGATEKLCRKLGEALASSGRGADAACYFLQAARGATAAEGLELRRLASTNLLLSGRVESGLSLLASILEPLGLGMPPTPRRALFSLLRHRAALRLRGTSFRERDETQVSAEALTRIDLCWSAAVGLSVIDPILGADFQAKGLLLALRAGEPFRVARSLAMEAAHQSTAGNRGAGRAAALIDATGALARKLDSPQIWGMLDLARGTNDLMLGRWQAAHESLDRAAATFRERCTGVTWERDTVNTFGLWALQHLGRIRELRERWSVLWKEAQRRGDLYAATTLTTYFMTMVRLADDDTSLIEDDVSTAMVPWSRQGFLVQHSTACRSLVHLDLYRGRVDRAWERLDSLWPEYSRSLLFRIQIVRILMRELRARCTLARAELIEAPADLLASAEKDARALEGERQTWAAGHGEYIRAGIAACRQDAIKAAHHLSRAAELYEQADMTLNAAVMRYRLGEIQVGDEARKLMSEAERAMRDQSIRSPGQWARMTAPGFSDIATCPAETTY